MVMTSVILNSISFGGVSGWSHAAARRPGTAITGSHRCIAPVRMSEVLLILTIRADAYKSICKEDMPQFL